MDFESPSAGGQDDIEGLTNGRVSTIGQDLTAESNVNKVINLNGLATSGINVSVFNNINCAFNFGNVDRTENLSIFNNTNCTFNFDQIQRVANLSFLDNEGTVLPLFPQLERAATVYLRGNINTSISPNFPVLTFTDGIVIEASNDDFNCSMSESEGNDNITQALACNGTDGSTETSSPGNDTTQIPSGPTRLSSRTLAGIGVLSGVIGLGIIAALIWISLRIRRRLKYLEAAQRQAALTKVERIESFRADTSGAHELNATGMMDTIREKPDDHLPRSRIFKNELPDNQIIELPAGEIKLPASRSSPQRPT